MLESTLSLTRPQARVLGVAGDAALLGATALFVALTFMMFGFWAFLGLAYALIAAWAVVHPQSFLLALLAAMIAVDPGVTSASSPLSLALYTLPPGADALIPYTVSPLEIALVLATASLALRVRTRAVRLPAMVWAMPAVVIAGIAYGIWKGAPSNLAYIEARGLIFGAIIFFTAIKMREVPATAVLRSVVAGTAALAAVILFQYFTEYRGGSGLGDDFAFAHENVVLLGEDIAAFGGAYRVTEGLLDQFGAERVRDTPISEIAIAGAAIGAALTGLRPVAEFQFNDFMACAMDQICNQAAKIRFMMGGQVRVPLVFRAPYGATGRAAQHSQSLEAWFMHTPGLKVAMPSSPYDAKGLLKTAIRDDNPVVFLEHKLLYGARSPGGKAKTVVHELGDAFRPAPAEEYTIPFGSADIKRAGADVTIVATGLMVYKALAAAGALEAEGIDAEVIDPRTLVPLDEAAILASVAKTSRLVVVSEDVRTCGVTAEIAAVVADEGLMYLDAPVKRVAVPDTPVPFAPVMESAVIPDVARIVQAVRDLFA